MRIVSTLVGVSLLLLPSLAFADESPPDSVKPETEHHDDASASKGKFLLGAKVGGLLSFGGLSPNARVGVEVGYVFPWAKQAFAATVNVDYAAPKSTGTEVGDPRVGGTYNWHLTEQVLTIMPTLYYRITSLGKVVPYIGVGPRIYLLQSNVTGSVGTSAIPETTEQSTAVGFGVPLGAEIKVGPGGVTAEVLFEYGSLNHTATGSSNTGALSLLLGYRFLL